MSRLVFEDKKTKKSLDFPHLTSQPSLFNWIAYANVHDAITRNVRNFLRERRLSQPGIKQNALRIFTGTSVSDRARLYIRWGKVWKAAAVSRKGARKEKKETSSESRSRARLDFIFSLRAGPILTRLEHNENRSAVFRSFLARDAAIMSARNKEGAYLLSRADSSSHRAAYPDVELIHSVSLGAHRRPADVARWLCLIVVAEQRPPLARTRYSRELNSHCPSYFAKTHREKERDMSSLSKRGAD